MKKERFTITVPSRLHCGLLNESGCFGRVDGGLGFGLQAPRWLLEVNRDGNHNLELLGPELRLKLLSTSLELSNWAGISPLYFNIQESVPLHAGFGAKTSLLMGVAAAYFYALGLPFDALLAARLVGRGGTSGIGVHVAQSGGFVWDFGRRFPEDKASFGPSSEIIADPPQLLMRVDLPRFSTVHVRFEEQGMSGRAEIDLFRSSCPIPMQETLTTLSIVSSLLVPGLLLDKEDELQQGLKLIQDLGLKKREWDGQSIKTANFRSYWKESGIQEALCLSSMGPTMFAVTKNPQSVLDVAMCYKELPLSFGVSAIDSQGVMINA